MRKKLARLGRLGKIIIRSCFKPEDLVLHLRLGREHDDRNIARGWFGP